MIYERNWSTIARQVGEPCARKNQEKQCFQSVLFLYEQKLQLFTKKHVCPNTVVNGMRFAVCLQSYKALRPPQALGYDASSLSQTFGLQVSNTPTGR